MAVLRSPHPGLMWILSVNSSLPSVTTTLKRTMYTTVVTMSKQRRFPENNPYNNRCNGHERGPLTELPDWSYGNGMPAPLTGCRRTERVKQMNYAKKIVQLLWEVDFAVERHRKAEQDRQDEIQKAFDDQLKPNGHLLDMDPSSSTSSVSDMSEKT